MALLGRVARQASLCLRTVRRPASTAAAQVEAYTTQGFIDRVEVLPEAAMAGALAVVDRLEREQDGRLPAQLLSPHLLHPELAQLALAPALLDTVSALLGPDVVLLSTALFTKYPVEEAGAQYVGAHQDLKYWGIVPLIAASAWVSLDGAGPHNGAMLFLPGSHRAGLLEHGQGDRDTNVLKDNQDIALTEEQRGRLVQSHLRPGQASVHDGLTVHLSPPNPSQGRRAGLAVIFVTPEVRVEEMMYENSYTEDWRQPVLARGEDRFGHLDYWTTAEDLLAGRARHASE